MIERLKRSFEGLDVVSSIQSPESNPVKIPYGEFRLADNPKLAAHLCNHVAEETGAFWTFTEFKRLQNNSPEKPVEPDPDDLALWPAPNDPLPPALIAKHGPQKTRKLVAAYNLTQARNGYETALKDYQKLQLQIRSIRASADYSDRGYMVAFCDALSVGFPAFVQDFFFTPTQLIIDERAREKHTFICAGTGAGKSETAKTILRHYVTRNTDTAVVLLDPHGKLAEEVARFEELAKSDRLVYVRPRFFKGRNVSFNPFEFSGKDEDSLDLAVQHFMGALKEIIGKDFTDTQESLLGPILTVLFHKDGTDFRDLVRFMDDSRNRDLVAHGKAHIPNEIDQSFFEHEFALENFDSTKKALRYRFNNAIRSPLVREFFCNPTTINLPELIEAGKFIVFQFDKKKQGEKSVRLIGQFINAFLVSYSFQRPEGSKVIHLFADECQYFVSPTIEEIMGESRKFGLHATLVAQGIDQLSRDLQKAMIRNVGSYIVGRSKGDTAKKMSEENPRLSKEDIQDLPDLTFYQIQLDRPPVKTRIQYIGNRFGLKGEAWRDVLLKQGATYYAPGHPTSHEHAPAAPSEPLSEANAARQHRPTGRKPMFAPPSFAKDKK